ncbi:hypothetical protein KGO95_01890 [Patescibacteria group bacterium]|nr:hypothetical protein [Patescibacteria group bacterium]
MKEKFSPEHSVSESENEKVHREYRETEEKNKQEIIREFDPKLTDLYDRIIMHLSEHGSGNTEELKRFNKEGNKLSGQFFDKVEDVGKVFNKKFKQYGFLEFEMDWTTDLVWYRNDQREKRHRQDIKPIQDFIKRKPPISEIRAMIEKAKKEVVSWEKLGKDLEKKLGEDFVGSAVWDAIEENISDIEEKNGLNLLENALEELKDERQEYTKEDYKEALEEANKDYGGRSNNPNAGRARQQAADRRLRTVEQALKQSGKIEKTPEERLTEELDQVYPNAKSKTVVEYQGKKYQVRYFPLETSRTGKTVFEWGHQWVPFSEESVKKSSIKRTKKG